MTDLFEDLIAAAIAVRERAYAPYSNHPVGAAILDENGVIHAGCNVENAAYPQGACAEAGAISTMIAAGARRIEAIAIAGPGDHLCTPCGGCRQRIREFAARETPILIAGRDALLARFTLGELLPESFGPDNLEGITAKPNEV
ncbi:MAG: cytidine deaminase [Pseudomonadota bacterium]